MGHRESPTGAGSLSTNIYASIYLGHRRKVCSHLSARCFGGNNSRLLAKEHKIAPVGIVRFELASSSSAVMPPSIVLDPSPSSLAQIRAKILMRFCAVVESVSTLLLGCCTCGCGGCRNWRLLNDLIGEEPTQLRLSLICQSRIALRMSSVMRTPSSTNGELRTSPVIKISCTTE